MEFSKQIEDKKEEDIYKQIDNMTLEELEEFIKSNRILAIKLEREINQLKEIKPKERKTETVEYSLPPPIQYDKIVKIPEVEEKEFQDEVDYYYSLINSIESTSISIENITNSLPLNNKSNYSNIILGIKLRLLKVIKEYKDLIEEGKDQIDSDFLYDIKKEIIATQTKINLIEKANAEKATINTIEPIKNNLFFSLSPTGNVSVIDDIQKEVPKEAYNYFKILFDSITDGTFKGVKRFSGNYYYSFMAEVRYREARVIFDRVGKNDYVILGAFLKKTTSGKSYKGNLSANVNSYLSYKDNIVNNLNSEDFRRQNHKYEEELYKILEVKKEKNKQHKKGGNN